MVIVLWVTRTQSIMSELILLCTIHYFCTITVPLAREIKETPIRETISSCFPFILYLQARLHHCCYWLCLCIPSLQSTVYWLSTTIIMLVMGLTDSLFSWINTWVQQWLASIQLIFVYIIFDLYVFHINQFIWSFIFRYQSNYIMNCIMFFFILTFPYWSINLLLQIFGNNCPWW